MILQHLSHLDLLQYLHSESMRSYGGPPAGMQAIDI